MTDYIQMGSMRVMRGLHDFVNREVLPGLNFDPAEFWDGVEDLLCDLAPRNRALLEKRKTLQQQIDNWHKENTKSSSLTTNHYQSFLEETGYIVPEGPDFQINVANVDPEISDIAGPQLVVPLLNARYALNAANARWFSLYDSLYGTDAIPQSEASPQTDQYDPARGKKVVAYCKAFLDTTFPLTSGTHDDALRYYVDNGALVVELPHGKTVHLSNAEKFIGYIGPDENPRTILLKNNGLHIELIINRDTDVGRLDSAGISDIFVEAAVTTIMDAEDSVTAVTCDDKVRVYRNWLGLMTGTLTTSFSKDGKTVGRNLNPDKLYTTADKRELTLPGRSLMLIRNVGLLMTNEAILLPDGSEVPEGLVDAVMTSLIAMYDLNRKHEKQNSKTGSIYIVKPKLHGPEECQFAVDSFEKVENLLRLPKCTIKIGIMDEERRTTLNLKECIRTAKNRVVFINTGFLDRTGDEIHTSMAAGPMRPKGAMKKAAWFEAYEKWNVDIGLACGFMSKAQIGKGMWPMPDNMADMLEQKIGQLKAGASTAWAPSPSAAALHALHYHAVNVKLIQKGLLDRERAHIADILSIPILKQKLNDSLIKDEIENNVQGILGYVVRWVDQGIGCSKVPDINNIGLMEDRATLRISSQHLSNWLYHGICSQEMVDNAFIKMAKIVDTQNQNDPHYQPMSANLDSNIAFQAARKLVFEGKDQPNGYTEPILHAQRRNKLNTLV